MKNTSFELMVECGNYYFQVPWAQKEVLNKFCLNLHNVCKHGCDKWRLLNGILLLQTDSTPMMVIERDYELLCQKCEEHVESIIKSNNLFPMNNQSYNVFKIKRRNYKLYLLRLLYYTTVEQPTTHYFVSEWSEQNAFAINYNIKKHETPIIDCLWTIWITLYSINIID